MKAVYGLRSASSRPVLSAVESLRAVLGERAPAEVWHQPASRDKDQSLAGPPARDRSIDRGLTAGDVAAMLPIASSSHFIAPGKIRSLWLGRKAMNSPASLLRR